MLRVANKFRTLTRVMRHEIERYLVTDELRARHLDAALDHLQAHMRAERQAAPSSERPIFILSSGWRCGSTLLQRVLSSNPALMMWGEPFGDWSPIARMASMLSAFDPTSRHIEYAIEKFSGSRTEQFIANLNPGFGALQRAHAEFFDTLLARPARERGFSQWGAKWVRLNAAHARYLRWLYPESRFVFITRDPLDAYRSFKGRGPWFSLRPSHMVTNVFRFAAHWEQTASSFVARRSELSALLLRYEDLVSDPAVLDRLEEWCGLRLDRSVISKRVGQTENKPTHLPWWEVRACRHLTRSTAPALGYA